MHICVYVAEWQHLALNLLSHLEILQRRKRAAHGLQRNAFLLGYVERRYLRLCMCTAHCAVCAVTGTHNL